MSYIAKAIREAVENGNYTHGDIATFLFLSEDEKTMRVYRVNGYGWVAFFVNDGSQAEKYLTTMRVEQILLDPLFWQAFGKSRGWGTEPAATTPSGFPVQEWLMFWHRFIDHLAEGKDAESFFQSLYK